MPWAASPEAHADTSSTLPTAINLPSGPGSLEGFGQGYDVSPSSGLPKLGYDIALPPGRGGLVPRFQLGYHGGGAAGVVGLGWSLELPAIELATRIGIPRYDASDTLTLRGLGSSEELVAIDNGLWREGIEGASPVEVHTFGEGFEARTVDGTRYVFGTRSASRLEGANGTFRWDIDRIVDRLGNVVEFSYTALPDTTAHVLAGASWNDGEARVAFAYEERPDRIVSRASGFESRLSHRLVGIETHVGGELVQRWTLAYENTLEAPVSRLVSIASEAADGTKLPTWHMEYAGGLDRDVEPTILEGGPALDPTAQGRAWVDVNGDALPDVLEGTAGAWRYRQNRAGQSLTDWIDLPTSPSVDVNKASRFADLTGDGVADLLVQSSPGGEARAYVGAGEHPFGTSETLSLPGSFDLASTSLTMIDLNLDGRVDLFHQGEADAWVWMRAFAGGFLPVTSVDPLPLGIQLGHPDVRFVDVDGDRLPDATRLMPQDGRLLVATGMGHGRFATPTEMSGIPMMSLTDRFELHDVNGDGAADLVRVGSTSLELWINQLDSTFAMTMGVSWPALESDEKIIFSDVNGNGTTDVLRVDEDGSQSWRYWDLFGQKPGLLTSFENGLGYDIVFEYTTPGEQADAAERSGQSWTSVAPEGMPILARTVEHDGLDWERVVEHEFRDAWYDSVKGEFRGFRHVTERRLADPWAEERVTRSTYSLGEDEEAKKLQLVEQEVATTRGVVSRTVHTLEVETPLVGVRVARRIRSDVWNIETGALEQAQRIATEVDYDEWGNVLAKREWGLVDLETGEDTPGDERFTFSTYASPMNDTGPRNLMSETTVSDTTGAWVQATRAYYDGEPERGLALGKLDERGSLHRQDTWLEGNTWVPTMRQAFDRFGNIIRLRDAEDGLLERIYDDLGRFPIEERVILDERSTIEHLVVTADWDFRFGKPTRVTDAAGATTTVAYDGLGRPVAIAEPGDTLELPTTRYLYYLDGLAVPRPAIATELRRVSGQPEVDRSIDQLDGLGRLRHRISQDDAGERAVLVEARTYDVEGQVCVVRSGQFVDAGALDPGIHVDTVESWPADTTWRDATGRTLATRDADGRRTQTTYGPLVTETRDNGDLTGQAPYRDSPTRTSTDGLGRVVSVEEMLSDRSVLHAYLHDASDRLVGYTDPGGAITRYGYDGGGRLRLVESPDAGAFVQRFDDAGRVVERTDATGAKVTFAYDRMGRLLHETGLAPGGEVDGEVLLHYDTPRNVGEGAEHSFSEGRLSAVEDDGGDIDFVYDARGRKVRTARMFQRDGEEVRLSVSEVLDAQDRVLQTTFPDGSTLARTYSPRGLELSAGSFVEHIEYDALGRWNSMRLGNGIEHRRELDRSGRITAQTAASGKSVVLALEHAYDTAGLLKKTTDIVGATDSSPALTQVFHYDDLHRLVSARDDDGDQQWTYRDDGNLLEQHGLAITYADDRPHAAVGLGTQVLAYDAAGQLAAVSGEGPLASGAWKFDAHGRVRSFERDDGRGLQHVYDHTGQRAIRRELDGSGKVTHEVLYFGAAIEVRGSNIVRWIHAANQRLAESSTELPEGGYPILPLPEGLTGGFVVTAAAGRSRRSRRLRARLGAWFNTLTLALLTLLVVVGGCRTASPTGTRDLDVDQNARFHVQDRLGSASLVLDHEGQVIARSAHRPYGERWIDEQTEGTRPSDYRFTDKEEDLLSGAIYIGARHYLPAVGRWASPDPALLTSNLVAKNPREGNPYQYTLSNPVNGTDPTGLDTTGEVIDQHKERAEANNRPVEAVAWSVLGAAWSVLGAENLSKVVDHVINDRDDMTPGDYAGAVVESTVVVGVVAKGIKKLGSALSGVARKIVGTRHSAAQAAATTKSAAGAGQRLLGPARNFAEGQLEKHFAKHAGEWGAGNITQTGYLKRAQDLLSREVGGDILGATRSGGDILRYNVRTNEFAVGAADGTIHTLFRPQDGMSYWLEQVGP